MRIIHALCNGIIKLILIIFCKIERKELEKIPLAGPYVLVANHINFLEAPILYLFLRPRRTIALGKAELWEKRSTAFLMKLWEVIPIKRGAADFAGMRKALDVLREGHFLCLAPEGTRSRTGKLKRGKAGAVLLAQKGDVPILPVAHWGGERLGENLKRFRRTRISIRVGDPLVIRKDARRADSEGRQQIADEIMTSLARLMPREYHGYYQDKTEEPFRYLIPPGEEESL